jgi:hypothetical protein
VDVKQSLLTLTKYYAKQTKSILGQMNKFEDEKPEKFNPEPMPFHPQLFRSAQIIGVDPMSRVY